MTVRLRQNVPITETWARDTWTNFQASQAISNSNNFGQVGDGGSNNFGVATQNHIDVRTFLEGTWSVIAAGGLYPATNLYPSTTLYPTPNDCSITTGYQTLTNGSAHARWPVGQMTIAGAVTGTATSNYIQPIDLTAIGSTSNLTVALYNFPLSNVDLTNSYLDLSSDGFNLAITSLKWSTSTTVPIAGNCALTWPYAALTGIALNAVTGVRFRIKAINSCTVTMLALRLIGPNWVATNMDFDNLDDQFRQCIPLTGDPAALPVTNNKVLPTLWRSAATPGIDDPRPIDAEMGVVFNTGSQTTSNNCTLYMRGNTDPYVLQQDLENFTQSTLTGNAPPTFGLTEPARNRWTSFSLNWGPNNNSIQITDASGRIGYQWTTGWNLTKHTTYVLICNITDNTARLTIWNVNQSTLALTTPVFETTIIPDLAMFIRHPGRIGFSASLGDGDGYIKSIRPRSLVFAEYRSAALQSFTPVQGAQLFVQNSPDTELFQIANTVLNSGWNVVVTNPKPMITIDQQRFLTDHTDNQSTKVTFTTPATISQGIISNYLTPFNDTVSGITNFDALHIVLVLWIPGVALNSGVFHGDPNNQVISLALVSDQGNTLPITLPDLVGDQWQQISIHQPVPSSPIYPLSGQYQLALYYAGSVPTSIWVDQVSIHEHPMRWEARSVVDDPWSSNEAPWTDLTAVVNDTTNGARFINQGASLQLRGRAFQQDSTVLNQPNLIPQYAQLGRLVWPEDAPTNLSVPTAVLTSSHTGRQYTFRGTSSSSPNVVGDWFWDFGDGTYGSGPVVSHTYPTWLASGTYVVTLIVTDQYDQVAQTSVQIVL